MNKEMSVNIRLMEGRTYILGREGHIYIDSPTASKQHAEIKVVNGKIYLRDLDSTNGTYLLKHNRLVYFEQGFVNPLQRVVIGDQKHTIYNLLAIACDFAAKDDATTQLNNIDWKLKNQGCA
ncbi:MAG: FHA domain-containing protein [Gammaproteobacteria bacterium]|nr:FHA domain-containing protein [Gammaproteobacteria bacterium]